jgi:hypothetical protein
VIGKIGYRRRVARSLEQAGGVIVEGIESSDIDERLQLVLIAAVQTQADTLHQLVVGQRGQDTLPDELIPAMRDPKAAERALRVATWALVLRIPKSRLGRRYPGVGEAAVTALGIDNDWEHRLVFFEPTAVPEMQQLQFDRYTVEGVVAVATGIENPKPIPLLMWWVHEMTPAVAGLVAMMDQLDPDPPQPGFSRLAEVEAEIKARQATDPASE